MRPRIANALIVLTLVGPAAFVVAHPDMLVGWLGLAIQLVPLLVAAVAMALLLRRVAAGRHVSGVLILFVAALPWVASIVRLLYSRSNIIEARRVGGWAYPQLMALGVAEGARFWLLGLLGSTGLYLCASTGLAFAPSPPEHRAARRGVLVLAGWLALIFAFFAFDLASSSALLHGTSVPPDGASLAHAERIHFVCLALVVAGSLAAVTAILAAARPKRSVLGAVATGLVAVAIAASLPLSLQAVVRALDSGARAPYRPWDVVRGFEPGSIAGEGDRGFEVAGRAFRAGLAGPSLLVVGRSWAAVLDRHGREVGEPLELRRQGGRALEALFRQLLRRDGPQERRAFVVEGQEVVTSPCVEVALDGRLRTGTLRAVLEAAGEAGVRSLLLVGRTPGSVTATEQARLRHTLPLVAPFTLLRASAPVVLASALAQRVAGGSPAGAEPDDSAQRMVLLRVRVEDSQTASFVLRSIGELRSPQPDRQTIVLLEAAR